MSVQLCVCVCVLTVAPGLVTNLTAFAQNHTSVSVKWFLPHRINGLITKFAVKAKLARTGQTVRNLLVNAEDIMTGTLPHCNVRPLKWTFKILKLIPGPFLPARVLICLGCSRYSVSSDHQPLGNDGGVSNLHSYCRAPRSCLERAHLSRGRSASALHCLSF